MHVVLKSDVLWRHILRRNMSLNEFSERSGLRSGHLSQLLAGKRQPTGIVREKLLMATATENSPAMDFDDLFEIVPVKTEGGQI